MSVTHDLYCSQCDVSVWFGQNQGLYRDKKTLDDLEAFIFKHQCHILTVLSDGEPRNVKTTNNLSSKDSVITPKKDLVSNAEDKPEPVMPWEKPKCMPSEVVKLLDMIDDWPGDSGTIATYATSAVPHLYAAYQRIADLEKGWKEAERQTVATYRRLDKELTQLKAQLAAMREAGNALSEHLPYYSPMFIAWKAASNNQDPRPAPTGEKSKDL